MNKKGFTLIELLAVIVILAIIALIATPIVLDVISDARKSSTEISMENIEKAVSLYFQKNNKDENIIFECNKEKCKFGEKELEINGKSPESGRIIIDKKGNITYEDIVLNGFNCYKEYKKFVCDSKKTRKTYNESKIVIKSESEYNLFDYNIYGNSIQNETTSQYESVGEKTINLYSGEREITHSKIENITHESFYEAFEIGKTYTLFCYIDNTYGTEITTFRMSVGKSDYWLYNQSNNIVTGDKGWSKTTFTIPEDYNGQLNMQYQVRGGTAIFKDIMLVEGNYNIDNLPIYEPYGYKIPIKINGKNLLDKNLSQIGYWNQYIRADGSTPFGQMWYELIPYTGQTSTSIAWYVTNPIPIKPNTVYSYSGLQFAYNPAYIFLEEDRTTIINGAAIYESGTFTTPENAKYIVMSIRNDVLETMMLQEGGITEYEPYINPKIINIYMDEPLRKVGDKADYIDFKNKKVVRYIEEDSLGNLKTLSTPKEEKIELPDILLQKGSNNIEIATNIKPSKIELEYYK